MYYNGATAGSRFVISRSATGGPEIELESGGNINLNRTGNGKVLVGSQIDMDSNKIVNLLDPTAAQDAATKAYVDANAGTGTVTGTGTTDTLPVWTDGVAGVLGDSVFSQNVVTEEAFVSGKLVGTGGANNPDFYIESQTDDIIIRTTADDKDVFIQSDNGSGQIATYFQADGSTGAAKLFHYGGRKLETTANGVDLFGEIQFNNYGSGTITGTAAYNISVDASGNLIETPNPSGGGAWTT